MLDTPINDLADDDSARQEQMAQRAALETMLQRRLKASIDARRSSGIESIWQEDQDQYDGYDPLNPAEGPAQPTSKAQPLNSASTQRRGNGPRSRVFLNITKPKTDTSCARVSEMALPTDDRPWEYQPTPVPEIEDAIERQDERPIQLADGETATAAQVAATLQAKARDKAQRMQDHVDDWFVEGSVYSEMRKVLRDAARIGTGVLKGPVPVSRKDRRWRMQDGMAVLEVVERIAPTSVCKSAWDIFPDPSVTDNLHTGAWVWERDAMTARMVRGLAQLPGYDADELAEVLKEGPLGIGEYEDRFQRQRNGVSNRAHSETFEVWHYWGDIDAETLIAGNFVVPGVLDAMDEDDDESKLNRAEQTLRALQLVTVPVMVSLINGRIVRVVANPLESGDFPFDVLPWEPVDGQIWGRGVPRKMGVAQRMLNAATRALLENAGMAAGPQIVAMRDYIEPADQSANITGRKLWWFTPKDDVRDVRAAFAVHTIEPVQQQLQAIIDFSLAMADQLSNLPLLMQGAQGQAPDTVGGMAMLQANATSPLKAIAKLADDLLFIPHLTRYYDWGMQDPLVPEEAKGDMRVKARAASALVYRDFLAGFLPQLLPFVKDPAFRLDPEKFIAELLRANRFNPEQVKLTSDQIKQLEEQQASAPPDPRLAAAQITAEQRQAAQEMVLADKQAERQFKAEQADRDRQFDAYVADVEFQIQAMEFAGQKEITFDQLKAMLATKAMDIRNKREMFAAERQFAEGPGGGRGL